MRCLEAYAERVLRYFPASRTDGRTLAGRRSATGSTKQNAKQHSAWTVIRCRQVRCDVGAGVTNPPASRSHAQV